MTRAIKLLLLPLALTLGIVSSILVYTMQQSPKKSFVATDITGVPWAHDFELVDHNGQRRTLADFRGKVVLLFFGYTNCPDACPTALAEMAQLVERLGPQGKQVQGLFITTDPARDTAQRLATYVTAFHPSFLGLRGTPDEIANVTKAFKVHFRTNAPAADTHAGHSSEPADYMVDHSTGILVFDRDGRVRLYVRAHGRSVDAMVHDVELLLKS
jgi:protein SCO1/2